MKKILFLATALLGAIPASQAGINLHLGIGLPLPLPPPFIFGHRSHVVVQPAPLPCDPGVPLVVAPPVVCAPPVVYATPRVVCAPAPVYYGHYYYPNGPGYYAHRGYGRYQGHRY